MWFEEDEDCINYDESPREEEEAKRTYSVDLDCDDGGSCRYSITERSKHSVILGKCIEFFAGFEPPMDSVETDRLFEEALVNLCRPEEPDFRGADAFLRTFKPGPSRGEVRCTYAVERDYHDPSHHTLVAVFHVRVEADLDQVAKRAGTGRFEFASHARSFQTKDPRLESASRDDRSSKNQPKRVENDREKSL